MAEPGSLARRAAGVLLHMGRSGRFRPDTTLRCSARRSSPATRCARGYDLANDRQDPTGRICPRLVVVRGGEGASAFLFMSIDRSEVLGKLAGAESKEYFFIESARSSSD
jgi:hypothetical protein